MADAIPATAAPKNPAAPKNAPQNIQMPATVSAPASTAAVVAAQNALPNELKNDTVTVLDPVGIVSESGTPARKVEQTASGFVITSY